MNRTTLHNNAIICTAGSLIGSGLQHGIENLISLYHVAGLGQAQLSSKTATTHLLDIPDLLAVVQEWDSYMREVSPPSGLWYPTLLRDGTGVDLAATGHPNRRSQFDVELRALCERAGVPYRSPHKIRHGHAVYALKQAQTLADYKAISQNMMHASL